MNPFIKTALAASLVLVGACAQTPTRGTDVSAITQPEDASDEARNAFFVHNARSGDIAALTKELDKGIDINVFDTLSQTALIAAVSQNKFDAAKLLLERGAKVDLADPAGWTPLIHATYSASAPDILKLLLDHGADINASNDRGVTSLYIASSVGREPQVLFLLAHGADPALATTSGYTAKRVAQLRGLDRIVALLDGQQPAPQAPTAHP